MDDSDCSWSPTYKAMVEEAGGIWVPPLKTVEEAGCIWVPPLKTTDDSDSSNIGREVMKSGGYKKMKFDFNKKAKAKITNIVLEMFDDIDADGDVGQKQKMKNKKESRQRQKYVIQEDIKTMSIAEKISSNSQIEWETRLRNKSLPLYIQAGFYEAPTVGHRKIVLSFIDNDLEEKVNYIASNIRWYILDPNRPYHPKDNTYTTVSPTIDCGALEMEIRHGIFSFPCGFSCICCEGSLFMIGVTFDLNMEPYGGRRVLVYDDSSSTWRKHSDMLSPRSVPFVYVLDEKIYVFSTTSGVVSAIPWGEYFDPQTSHWNPIEDPPQELSDARCPITSCVTVGDRSVLFMTVHNGLFSYGATHGVWKKITTPLSYSWFWGLGATYMDGILFFFTQGMITAYDLATEAWFEEEVKGLGICSTSCAPPDHLYFGYVFKVAPKLLCVVWTENDNFFRCIKFSVSRVNNLLYAHIMCRSSYCVRKDARLQYCFTL